MEPGDDEPRRQTLLRPVKPFESYIERHRTSKPGVYFYPVNLKGLLIDLDGTLYVGEEPIDGAREAIEKLESADLTLRYVTNTTRKPRRVIHEHLDSLGFEVEERQIFTPAIAAARLIGPKTCFPLVDESLLEDLATLTLTTKDPDYVLIGDLGEDFTYARLNPAFRHLMNGADLVALQKNRYWRKPDGFALDAGAFVAALEYASGKAAAIVGKPEKSFFRLALGEMELEPHEAGMVGDDPASDVAGARAAGLAGIQVKTGKYRSEDEVESDLALDSIAGLPEALGI